MIDALMLIAVLTAFLLLLLAVSRPSGGRGDNLGLFAFREVPQEDPPAKPPTGKAGKADREVGDA